MATNTDNVILLFKGDDTGGSFGRTVSFVVSVEAGASMDGCHAEFEYAGIVKEIAPPIVDGETRTIEYSAEETAKMPLGAGRGVLRVIDAGGKVRTATNTLPVMVTDCVPLAYPGESVISVTFKAADYDALANKPQVNGHTLTGNKSAADLGLAPAGNYATKADVTLTPTYGDPNNATWTIAYPQGWEHGDVYVRWNGDIEPYCWTMQCGVAEVSSSQDPNAATLSEELFGETITATRTDVVGYYLGSDNTKILTAKEALDALRTAVAAKYAKPSGGIPATDLAAAVQTSLGKADSALQAHQQLADVYGGNGEKYSAWTITAGPEPVAPNDLQVIWYHDQWCFAASVLADPIETGVTDLDATELSHQDTDWGCAATRTANPIISYQLGTQSDRKLATAAQGALAVTAVQPADLFTKLDSTSAAPAFSTSSTYAVGEYVTYNGGLYRCTTAVTTAGAWTGSTNWTADTMTDPDAVLDITAQNQLRVVAKDGTVLWAQGYDLASASSATLACDACNNFTFADGATSQAFTLPTAPTGKVGDFGLDVDNSANASAATMTLTGLDTAFSVVVPKGESLNDMLAIAAGELARFYITLSTFRVNNLPTWHIVKQVVENGGATV